MRLTATDPDGLFHQCYLDGKKVLAAEADEEGGWVECYVVGGRPALFEESVAKLDYDVHGNPKVVRFEGHVMLPCRSPRRPGGRGRPAGPGPSACPAGTRGRRFDTRRGDDKSLEDCKQKFDGSTHFGGFPPLPQVP